MQSQSQSLTCSRIFKRPNCLEPYASFQEQRCFISTKAVAEDDHGVTATTRYADDHYDRRRRHRDHSRQSTLAGMKFESARVMILCRCFVHRAAFVIRGSRTWMTSATLDPRVQHRRWQPYLCCRYQRAARLPRASSAESARESRLPYCIAPIGADPHHLGPSPGLGTFCIN